MSRWIVAWALVAAVGGGTRVQAQGGGASSQGDVLRVMLIPTLEYTNLQGIHKLAASDVVLIDVKDNLAGKELPPSMQKQMWDSYQESLTKQRSAIDSLRSNLKATQWCRYGACHPAPNNQIIRAVLAGHQLSADDVVALDSSHGDGVALYYEARGH